MKHLDARWRWTGINKTPIKSQINLCLVGVTHTKQTFYSIPTSSSLLSPRLSTQHQVLLPLLFQRPLTSHYLSSAICSRLPPRFVQDHEPFNWPSCHLSSLAHFSCPTADPVLLLNVINLCHNSTQNCPSTSHLMKSLRKAQGLPVSQYSTQNNVTTHFPLLSP